MESNNRQKLTIMEFIWRDTVFPTNGCWVYTGHLNSKGYGQIKYNDKLELVHRISYRIMKGRIPKGLFVLHKCDNPPCFNPDHLFVGTQLDNIRDMISKGRQNNNRNGY